MNQKLVVFLSLILAGASAAMFNTGCSSKPATSPSPAATPTPGLSTSAVTVISSINVAGIAYYGGDLWLAAGDTSLDEYTTAGVAVTAITTFNGGSFFSNVIGVSAGPDGTIYAADWGNGQIDVFNSAGVYQTNIPSLAHVISAATNSAGTTLYVMTQAPDIYMYSITAGSPKSFANVSTFTNLGAGELATPQFLVVDSSNNVYVSNQNFSSIVEYGPTGSNPVSFGSTALTAPEGLAINSAGDLYESQGANAASFIQEFVPSSGTFTAGVTFGNIAPGYYYGLAFDSSGNLWASDTHNSQILEFKYNN